MTIQKKEKISPCEGCRERKKKCTSGQPCERCQRLRIKCYYLKPSANLKTDASESTNAEELRVNVEFMEDIMNCMERDLHSLRNSSSSDSYSPSIRPKSTNASWQLELRKDGCISINTDILSYDSLLKHIQNFNPNSTGQFVFPLVKQPTLASLSAGGGYLLRRALSSVLRKGNIKAILRSIVIKKKQLPSLVMDSTPSIVVEKEDLLLQIIDCYFSCCYLNRVTLHKKTFYDLFIPRHYKKSRKKSEPSPAAYALAAAILTMRCKHVKSIVPYDQHMSLAEYYFAKAHRAVSLNFDDPSLETMTVYLELAAFKANTMQPAEAKLYLEFGLRIRQLLSETLYSRKPLYYSIISQSTTASSSSSSASESPPRRVETDSIERQRKTPRSRLYNRYLGEYENFHRMLAGFQDCVRFMQFVNKQRGVPLKHGESTAEPTRLFQYIMQERYDPQPLPDESKEAARAILKEGYLNRINMNMKQFFPYVRHGDSDVVPLSLVMDTEEKLKKAYFQNVPLDFRLSPAIFEDRLSDSEFKKRLAEDGRCDVHSVAIALRYYHSLISVHEPFLPVIPGSPALVSLPLIHEEHRKEDDEVLSVHSLRAQEICYHSAIKVVRLLEYQCTVLELCAVSRPALLSAWDIIMRNACLGLSELELSQIGVFEYMTMEDIQLAREYAVRCIEVLRRGHMYNSAERELWEHYEKIESQLQTALCRSPSPTARYWEPLSSC